MSAPKTTSGPLGLVTLTRHGGVVPLTILISSFVGAPRSENYSRLIENREID